MQINQEVKRASCSLVVSLKGLVNKSFVSTHNKVVEKFVVDNYNVIIAKHELQLKKKYKNFNTFEKEGVYQEGKDYADYLINRFYVEN